MSARFNLCSEMVVSNSDDDNNEAYVEIILDIFQDSVAINSIQGGAVLKDPELASLINEITVENRSSSSVRFSLFQSTCSYIKQVYQKLDTRIASLIRRFDQTKEAEVHALEGPKFIK